MYLRADEVNRTHGKTNILAVFISIMGLKEPVERVITLTCNDKNISLCHSCQMSWEVDGVLFWYVKTRKHAYVILTP